MSIVPSCGHDRAVSPTPVPRSLTVTAVPTGAQYQCSAVVGFSDGSTLDVTTQATWLSSDSTVAMVSSSGLVTPLATGTAVITAAYQEATGRMALAVAAPSAPPPRPAPPTYTLSGQVRATPLNELVAGAQIDATHGGLLIGSAMSDASGFYSIFGLIAQEYVLRVRRIGYNVRGIDVPVSGDTTRDITMDRNRVALQGTVREAPPCAGTAIQSALVQVLDGPDAGKSSLTDRDGLRYGIAGVAWGTFRARASKDGYASSEVTVSVPASDTVEGPFFQNFDLVRTLAQALFGEIRERRTEHAALIAGARVEVASGPDAGRSTVTDNRGQYRFEQLGTGTLTVRVTNPGYVDEVTTTSLCGDQQLNVRLTPTNAQFEGMVFDTTSGSLIPLEGATVQIVSGSLAGQMSVTNASGQYHFTGVYGRFTVRALKAGYTTEEHTITVTDPIVFWNFGLRRQ